MLYGLIGRKLGHSFSARYFNDKFYREKIPARYDLFELEDISSLNNLIYSHQDLYGFNVTIPYKRDILPFLDAVTPAARLIGAVNTVKVFRPKEPSSISSRKPILIGDNTDAPGFREALTHQLVSFMPDRNLKALVLGTGGASKAVLFALREMDIDTLSVSRKPLQGGMTYDDLNEEIVRKHQVIVNCTPLGMWPHIGSCPPIPYQAIGSGHLCFDLVYNPEITLFMRRCSERGAKVCNGLEMLYNQAKLAWEFWQKPVERKYLANEIKIHSDDGMIAKYRQSIVSISYAPDGQIEKIDFSGFTEETHSVEFVDSPLILHVPDKSTLQPLDSDYKNCEG